MLITDKIVHRIQLPRVQCQDSYSLEKIALDSRVLIVEGISGSGKDTLQADLKKTLRAEMYMTIPKATFCNRGANCRLRVFSNYRLGS